MPVGDLLAHCEAWGIPASEAAGLLTGSSPATVETAEILRPVAHAVLASGVAVASIGSVDDVRALSAEAREAVDSWLELHSWRLVTSDDVDRPTLAEVPALQVAALLCAAGHLVAETPDDAALRVACRPTSESCSTTCSPKLATGTASARTSVASAGTGPAGCCERPAGDRPPTG